MPSSAKWPWIITAVAVTAAVAVVIATISGWIGGRPGLNDDPAAARTHPETSPDVTDDSTAAGTLPDVNDQCMARTEAAEAATAVWTGPLDIAIAAEKSEAAAAWTDAFIVWPSYADAWAAVIDCYAVGSDRYWCGYDADTARDDIDSAVRSARLVVNAYAEYLLEADRESGDVFEDLVDIFDAYDVHVQAIDIAIEASLVATEAIATAVRCYDIPVT